MTTSIYYEIMCKIRYIIYHYIYWISIFKTHIDTVVLVQHFKILSRYDIPASSILAKKFSIWIRLFLPLIWIQLGSIFGVRKRHSNSCWFWKKERVLNITSYSYKKKKNLEAFDNDPSNAKHKVCFMIILLHNSGG